MAEEKFKEHEIVPQIIPNAPKLALSVVSEGEEWNLGNEITPRKTKFVPKIFYKDAIPEDMYSLVMIDPDILSKANPSLAQWLHWMIINIPGNNLIDGVIGGQCIMTYTGPTPGARTGLHRYIIFLWHQEKRIGYAKPASRSKFKVHDFFMKKCGLGDPLAGNFFMAKSEEG